MKRDKLQNKICYNSKGIAEHIRSIPSNVAYHTLCNPFSIPFNSHTKPMFNAQPLYVLPLKYDLEQKHWKSEEFHKFKHDLCKNESRPITSGTCKEASGKVGIKLLITDKYFNNLNTTSVIGLVSRKEVVWILMQDI